MKVYVDLMGGLGNQLFQHAFALFLAARGLPVEGLITNAYDGDTHSRRVLIEPWSALPVLRLPAHVLRRCGLLASEDGSQIAAVLGEHVGEPSEVLCRGYWQAPVYADAVAPELANALRRAWPVRPAEGGAVGEECCVHVRRGDYGHHGLLPVAYYLDCLERAGWPRFVVVSDEPNFCLSQFGRVQGFAGVVRGDTAAPWADFRRMADARIQVIANSSFSWWTAWLGRTMGTTQAVYAPGEWSLLPVADPCPTSWTRVACRLLRP